MADEWNQPRHAASVDELEKLRSGFMQMAGTLDEVATIIENLHLATTTQEAHAIRMEAARLIDRAKATR